MKKGSKKKKILITGGAGFIGYHLAKELLKSSDVELVLADNLRRGQKDRDLQELLKDKRTKFLDLDLSDVKAYKKLGKGYAEVYHLAAVNGTKFFYEIPHEVLRINTLTLVHTLEWFRQENKDGKILFPSSSEVYAGALEAFSRLPIPTPEGVPLVIRDPYNPRSSYDASKLISEPFLIHYAKQYDFRAVIVRPHNFYGPRAGFGHVIPDFYQRIQKKSDPFPIFGADNTRTFCYITDAVRAMILLMESSVTDKQPIEIVHIGSTQEITIKELAEEMFNVARWRPKALDIQNAPEGSVKRRLADVSKLQSLVDWKPEVSLAEGLKRTYEWYSAL